MIISTVSIGKVLTFAWQGAAYRRARSLAPLVSSGTITATDGTTIQVAADSVCVHGDSPNAVAMARAVRTGLEAAGIPLHPFAGPS